ncbi:carbonic anhydrase-related protein 10-like [Ylistrum balloti]|uniref:carbonic anhydrase-related protein 10-like n=1 Tax=Ylistrum balloti TaxID=509963 RepID=UPI002905EA42|nr:carbonic anhydrase-related protein 10-like [Ylistrum balloti]
MVQDSFNNDSIGSMVQDSFNNDSIGSMVQDSFNNDSIGSMVQNSFNNDSIGSMVQNKLSIMAIYGPGFWGTMNKLEWGICHRGKNQSPVNIVPEDLLFDPGLKHIQISGNKVSSTMNNLGNALVLYVNSSHGDEILFSIGPLSYTYRLHQIRVHFGRDDSRGSEHTIDGKTFAAEIQFLAYNTDLYHNFSQAVVSPRGIAAIAVFVQTKGNLSHQELEKIIENIEDVRFKGTSTPLKHLYIQKLIPRSLHYVTYDGSITHPGCHETVTWMIMNKPIYAGSQQIDAFRKLRQSGPENPMAFFRDNFRPTMPVNRRSIRTNINFVVKGCSMERNMHYQGMCYAN